MAKRSAEIEIKADAANAISQIESLKDRIKDLEKKLDTAGETSKKSAKKFDDAWGNTAKKAGENWKWFGDTVASAVEGTVSDLSRVINIANGISFAKAVDSARAYDATIGRMSAQTGQRVQDLRNRFEDFSKKKLIPEDESAALSKQLGKVTYDAIGAQKAMYALADEAVATGKDASEMIPLGTTLHNVFGIAGDTSDALKSIRGQSEAMGTVGGPVIIYDQMVKLDGVLQSVSARTPEAREKITALLTAMQGASQDPNRGAKVFGGLETFLQGHQVQIARAMHVDPRELTDDEGKIKPEMLAKFQKQFMKDYGRKKYGYEVAVNTFGSEIAKGLFTHDYAAEAAGIQSKKSDKASMQAADFYGSDPGKRLAAQQEAQRNARKSAEGAMPALDVLNNAAASHPFLTTLGISAGGGLLSKLAGGAIRNGVKALFRGGAGTAATEGGAGGGGSALSGAFGAGLGSAAIPLALLTPLKLLVDQQDDQKQKTIDEFNAANPVDDEAAKRFGTEYARSHKATVRSGGMKMFPDGGGIIPTHPMTGLGDESANQLSQFVNKGFDQIALTAAIKDAIKSTPAQFTFINATGGPIEAVTDQKGGGSGKQ